MDYIDIKSGNEWPSCALSNFASHSFQFRGLDVSSMEGFLQGLRFKDPDIQLHIFGLVGSVAKAAGKKREWRMTQTFMVPRKRNSKTF